MDPRRSSVVALVLLLGLVVFALGLGLCVQEDAFITFRYARNLVEGQGPVYNPGELVEGYTNFLWMLIVAGGMAAGLDPVPFARFLGLGCAVLLVSFVHVAARRHDRGRGVTRGLVATAIVACSPAIAVEAVQGLETVLFALLVTAGVWVGIRGRESAPALRPLLVSSLLLSLASVTRPEGVGVFALTTGAAWLWRLRRGDRPWRMGAEWAAIGLFVALYLPYWLWRFDYYGAFFPNTYYAKTGGGWWHVYRGALYLGRFLLQNPVLALLTVWAAWRGRRAASGAGALAPIALVVVTGVLLYVITVGGDFKRTFRFVIPVLPLWALLIDDAVSRHGWPWFSRRYGRAPAAAAWLFLGLLVANAAAGAPSTVSWARLRAWDMARRTACGRWLAANARPDALLAIHSAGIIPYYSGLRTIDMWGINDRHIARVKVPDMGRPHKRIGHEKEDTAYVFSRNPTYVIDEVFYAVEQSVPDLRRRMFVHPSSWPIAERYRERSVPLEITFQGRRQALWFNFLERLPAP